MKITNLFFFRQRVKLEAGAPVNDSRGYHRNFSLGTLLMASEMRNTEEAGGAG